MRKTKIVCTLGPSSDTTEKIKELIRCGMNVARLNFSHGTYESHRKTIDNFKEARAMTGKPVALLLDTKGPEIRIGKFEDKSGIVLYKGNTFTLTTRNVVGNDRIVGVTYKNLHNELKSGKKILIDDGQIELIVQYIRDTEINCEVITGGKLTDNKGMNIPHAHINMEYLSEKDKSDLLFGIKNDVDFVAASFVRSTDDVLQMRNFLNVNGGENIKIISKIENLEGINNYDSILSVSDGIMIARGDMGVEVAYEKIPGIQKRFINKCRMDGKMVITATQMLETMTENTMPTRAEITDVANAVFDGTSAVMLSGETAMGKHPELVVKAMVKIVNQAEEDNADMSNFSYNISALDKTNAICDAACITARDLNAKAIIAVTISGKAARLVSKFRPKEIIVATTPSLKTYYQLALSWGVYPILTSKQHTEQELIENSVDRAKADGIIRAGDTIVVTAGIPIDESGTTNLLKVVTI